MQAMQLDENYVVSPQILPQHIEQLKQMGFEVIINNRPDGEEPGQPSADEVAQACAEAGLDYHHIPMWGANFTGDDLAKTQAVIESGKKVFAFCRSGNRSSILFQAAKG